MSKRRPYKVRLASILFRSALFVVLLVPSFAFVRNLARPTTCLFVAHNKHRDGFQEENTYLATCIPGLASILEQEVNDSGCHNVQITSSSAVSFTADTATALTTILWTRTAHKIMELLLSSDQPIHDRHDLYNLIRDCVSVQDLLGNGRGGLLTLSVSVIINNAKQVPADINHSHFTALTIKNALVDAVRDLRGDRPTVDLEDPDVPLVCVLWGSTQGAYVSLYRQLHAGSLHKRGYRQGVIHKAALKESMAAGLILSTEWASGQPLIDPMAGSGSLIVEAAMIAADVAPGLMRIKCGASRIPPIVRWKHNHDIETEWRNLLLQATQRAKQGIRQQAAVGRLLYANDVHPGACNLLESALEASGLSSLVQVSQEDCPDWKPPLNTNQPWLIVTNPPWGVRLTDHMEESWQALSVFVKTQCPAGSQLFVLSGNPAATKYLGLRKNQSRLAIRTGQQDLRWIQYIIRERGVSSSGTKPREQRGNNTRTMDTTGPVENEWLI